VRAFWNDDEEELFVFRALDHFRRFSVLPPRDGAAAIGRRARGEPRCAPSGRAYRAPTSVPSPSSRRRRSACGCTGFPRRFRSSRSPSGNTSIATKARI
jgi:hypothetical protein